MSWMCHEHHVQVSVVSTHGKTACLQGSTLYVTQMHVQMTPQCNFAGTNSIACYVLHIVSASGADVCMFVPVSMLVCATCEHNVTFA